MKRDQSLIFTTVPEEDHFQTNVDIAVGNTRNRTRPKFLNLRSKTTDETTNSRLETESIYNTPFRGPTSVCSTPLTDIKKVLLPGTMSICTDPSKEECTDHKVVSDEISESFKTESINSILSAAEEKYHTSLHSVSCTKKLMNSAPYVSVGTSLYDKKKFSSMFELREKLKCLTKRITMKYYCKNPRELNKTFIAELEESPKKDYQKKSFQTITDPTFPVFRNDGKVISKSFYETYIETHLSLVNSGLKKSNDVTSENNTDEWRSVEDFDMCFRNTPKNRPITAEIEMQPLKKQQQTDQASKNTTKPRKSLTLPLKSLTSDSSESIFTPSNRKERFYGGVQLTPLMSKLSMLAMEERSSGFCSGDTTPSEYKDLLYTPSQPTFSFLKKGSTDTVDDIKNLENQNELRRCILFICGQQDMVVNVLLEESASSSSEVINKLV